MELTNKLELILFAYDVLSYFEDVRMLIPSIIMNN